MAIIIIIACCWILYRSGKAAALLEVFRLSPDTAPAEIETTPPEVFQDPEEPKQEPTPEPVKLETLERLQVENKAMIILKSKGIKEPLNLVKMYSDLELLEIIKEQ